MANELHMLPALRFGALPLPDVPAQQTPLLERGAFWQSPDAPIEIHASSATASIPERATGSGGFLAWLANALGHSRAVSGVMIGMLGFSILSGCDVAPQQGASAPGIEQTTQRAYYETDLELLQLREQIALRAEYSGSDLKAELKGLDRELARRIELADRRLRDLGLSEQQIGALDGSQRIATVALAEAFLPLHSKTAADVSVLRSIAEREAGSNLGLRHIAEMIAKRRELPYGSISWAGDVADLSAAARSQNFSIGVERAKAVHQDYGLRASPRTIEVLARLDGDQFRDLRALLDDLKREGGQYFTGYDDLARLEGLLPLVRGGKALVPPDGGGLSAFAIFGLSVDRGAFFEGVRVLAQKYRIAFTPVHAYAAAMLGGGSAAQKANLEALLERALPPSDVRDLTALAIDAGGVGAQPFDAKQLSMLDAAAARLGRKLSPPEIHVLLAAAKEGAAVQEIVPQGAPKNVWIKDLYTWSRLNQADREISAETLAQTIAQQITPGHARADINAWYAETFDATRVNSIELHKIRLLRTALDDGDFLAAIGDAIAQDLANHKGEAGGLITLENGQPSLVVMTSSGTSDVEFHPPDGTKPIHALASFHIHGADEPHGSPEAAGPSTNPWRTGGDLDSAWKGHQDGVVITRLTPDRINVDFYTTSGAVIDLGDFSLPAPSAP